MHAQVHNLYMALHLVLIFIHASTINWAPILMRNLAAVVVSYMLCHRGYRHIHPHTHCTSQTRGESQSVTGRSKCAYTLVSLADCSSVHRVFGGVDA